MEEADWMRTGGRLVSQIPGKPVPLTFLYLPPSRSGFFQEPELEGAAHSPNSFSCFSNLEIEELQRHLQGDACFRKGLCSQQPKAGGGGQALPWSTSKGLFAPLRALIPVS